MDPAWSIPRSSRRTSTPGNHGDYAPILSCPVVILSCPVLPCHLVLLYSPSNLNYLVRPNSGLTPIYNLTQPIISSAPGTRASGDRSGDETARCAREQGTGTRPGTRVLPGQLTVMFNNNIFSNDYIPSHPTLFYPNLSYPDFTFI